MKNLRDFLLSRKGWRDEKGNTLAFFERGLEGEPEKDALWIGYNKLDRFFKVI